MVTSKVKIIAMLNFIVLVYQEFAREIAMANRVSLAVSFSREVLLNSI